MSFLRMTFFNSRKRMYRVQKSWIEMPVATDGGTATEG
jgi:hypothetical protein